MRGQGIFPDFDALGQKRLTDAHQPNHFVFDNGGLELLGKPGQDSVRHQAFHLERYSRQRYIDHRSAIAVGMSKPHSRRGTPIVLYVLSVGGQIGLSAVDIGHFAASFHKKARHQVKGRLVTYHPHTKIRTEGFLGDIVFSGAKPTRYDNKVGALVSLPQTLQNGLDLIAHGCFTDGADADSGQFGADPLGVGIGYLAK